MAKPQQPQQKPHAPAPTPPPAEPRVGDVVHFVAPGGSLDPQAGAHRAALVTALDGETASLKVCPPFGTDYRVNAAARDEGGKAFGTWHVKD